MLDIPLFSIITVVFNDGVHIEETIQSVLQQKKELFEYIVIDGGSTDGTLDIIKKYSTEIDVVLSESDNGIYDAMNKGISLAKGMWVNFMNSGDIFESKDVLQTLAKYEIAESVMCFYGDTKLRFKSDFILKKSSQVKEGIVPDVVHQSTFCRTSYMKQNKFELKYSLCADYHLIYTMCTKKCLSVQYIPLTISIYDMNGKSQQMMRYYSEVVDIEGHFSAIRYSKFLVKSLLRSVFPHLYEYLYICQLKKKSV